MLNNLVLWGPLVLCSDEWQRSFSSVKRRWCTDRPAVNVTIITFAFIMKQRRPCLATGFVNGPTDGSRFGFVCTGAEVTTSGFLPRDQPQPLYLSSVAYSITAVFSVHVLHEESHGVWTRVKNAAVLSEFTDWFRNSCLFNVCVNAVVVQVLDPE